MNIDYSQFLNMIPEVTLMAILLVVFFVDLFTAQKAAPVAVAQAATGEQSLDKPRETSSVYMPPHGLGSISSSAP